MRLDIGWSDLLAGLFNCFLPGNRRRAVGAASDAWNARSDFLITLSVRSAFDLLLRALRLPTGTEVLMSALTVPDMVHIVERHGLVPVPVDTDVQGNIDVESLEQCLSARTRMIVIAHLFGGVASIDRVAQVCRERKILVVEDCAQSFRCVGESGHPKSDVAMFSFGPIKTATALGGAVVRVSSPQLLEEMQHILQTDRVQSRWSFARRVARFSGVKLLTGKWTAALFSAVVRMFGYELDRVANSLGRGFSGSDLLAQFRLQPSFPLLRLLKRRWRHFDETRIELRVQKGRRLDQRLGQQHASTHSYWVYPLFVDNPNDMRERLHSAGFDATCRSRMSIVPAVGNRRASAADQRWKQVIFLPWYPDLPDEAVSDMADLVCRS